MKAQPHHAPLRHSATSAAQFDFQLCRTVSDEAAKSSKACGTVRTVEPPLYAYARAHMGEFSETASNYTATVPHAAVTSPPDRLTNADREAVAAFLRECAGRGVTMRPDGATLRVAAAAGALTAELRARIAEMKPMVLAYHVTHPCTDCGRDYGFHESRRCYWCVQKKNRAGGIHGG